MRFDYQGRQHVNHGEKEGNMGILRLMSLRVTMCCLLFCSSRVCLAYPSLDFQERKLPHQLTASTLEPVSQAQPASLASPGTFPLPVATSMQNGAAQNPRRKGAEEDGEWEHFGHHNDACKHKVWRIYCLKNSLGCVKNCVLMCIELYQSSYMTVFISLVMHSRMESYRDTTKLSCHSSGYLPKFHPARSLIPRPKCMEMPISNTDTRPNSKCWHVFLLRTPTKIGL